ncbi:hypothetical protein PILCRDRAFT_783304 [Piloderma croceum F 1598]|uniref:Uncharacterized protein n=1 Tax=Piloderma croceum (strain F 1598) TaxID=765440 RepID=A0A0C3C0V9_PILCF|nr:hypothetical protein PILCRDRAFT_783304 [Piloderma croceum F 1598]
MAPSDPDDGNDPTGSQSPNQGSSQPLSRNLRKSVPASKEEALRIASGNISHLLKAKTHLVSKESLALSTSGLDDQQQELQENTVGLVNAALKMVETSNEVTLALSEAMDGLQNQLEIMPKTLKLTPATVNTANGLPAIAGNADPLTYAAITHRHLPPSHANALARNVERTCQIIIQPASDTPEALGLHSLSKLELISKAMLAFESINLADNPAPADFRFVGAKKLSAGNIVLDLNSPYAAKWLKHPDACASFMQNFSAVLTFKDYEYHVLTEFVPITFLPDSRTALEGVEQDSGAQKGGLICAEWAKLLEKRHALQPLAHLKLYFSSAETANYAIRNGLYIAGKKNLSVVQNTSDMATVTMKEPLISRRTANGCTILVGDVVIFTAKVTALPIWQLKAIASIVESVDTRFGTETVPYLQSDAGDSMRPTKKEISFTLLLRIPPHGKPHSPNPHRRWGIRILG